MTMDRTNYMRVVFPAKSENESLARILASSMAAQLDPTLEEISDLRTAVSAGRNQLHNPWLQTGQLQGNRDDM